MGSEPQTIMIEVADAVAKGRAGDRVSARDALGRLWKNVGAVGDPLFRCAIAHSMADLQDNFDEELKWDLLAMEAATSLTNERIREGGGDSSAEAFLPSLHLNLANDYLKLRQFSRAHRHLIEGRGFLVSLGVDGYREMIEKAFDRIAAELATSTK